MQIRDAYFKIRWFFLGAAERHYLDLLATHLKGCKTVLDLGCGSQPFLWKCLEIERIFGVDGWLKSCSVAKNIPKYVGVVQAELIDLPFKPCAVDGVVMLQVLEHLPKEDGQHLLLELEKIARQRIIVTTPNGYVSQNEIDGNINQKHLSGWSVGDFLVRGYSVFGYEGLRRLRFKGTSRMVWPRKFWSILVSLGLFERYLIWRPRSAFQLLAVKSIKYG